MLRLFGSAGARASPLSSGRPSRSGHRAVLSLTNFQPVGLVESATGLYDRYARMRPSKPGMANPAVISMFERCGSGWLDDETMSVFGRLLPFESFAFSRFTVPTIGLTGRYSVALLRSKSAARAKPLWRAWVSAA